MSIEKQTLFLPVREEGNKKLHHLYHIITRVYEDISKVAPATIESINKYDLVAQNIDEAILLLSFRERQSKRLDDYSKKLKKLFQKL